VTTRIPIVHIFRFYPMPHISPSMHLFRSGGTA
jgi:hypothetical protein